MTLPHGQNGTTADAPAANRAPLRAAVLSDRATDTMAALARLDITAIDATRADLALLTRDRPDILILDIAPGTLTARRIALLVAQLRWTRPDLVIAVAAGRSAIAQGFPVDLIFDATAPLDMLETTLADLRHVLTHSRLRPTPTTGAAPALLRRAAERRASLFR